MKVTRILGRIKYFILVLALIFLQQNHLSAASFDHNYSEWGRLLSWHVKDGFVDYASIKKSPEILDNIIKNFEVVSRDEYNKWSQDEKKAFWINAYNIGVIKLVVDYYPLKSMSETYPKGNIRQIPRVWSRNVFKILGKKVSLTKIEHKILRKRFQDPRIHFTLVCATMGCPELRSEPYVSSKLNTQMEDQVSIFLDSFEKASYDEKRDILYLSPIFKWFKRDFKQSGGIISFIKKHISKKSAENMSQNTKIRWLDYDWSLNDKM